VEKQEGSRPKDIHRVMVLRRNTRGIVKLEEKREGPFLLSKTRQGAYRLQTLEGEEVPYSWNQYKL
jgi:hypothetical protein